MIYLEVWNNGVWVIEPFEIFSIRIDSNGEKWFHCKNKDKIRMIKEKNNVFSPKTSGGTL